ncbi:MAG TPA: thioredoxin domain-containing protein [Mycobacteriales bacterium]|nr:thioredoxin domain-containing protein [Mycobacteriales bacterium]
MTAGMAAGRTVLRAVLAALWAYTAVRTIGDPAATVRSVRGYELLPDGLERGVGYGLPFLALALAVLLLIGLAVRITALVSAVLLVLFLIGAVVAEVSTGAAIAAVGLVAAVVLALWPRTLWALDDVVRRRVRVPETRVGPRRTAEARRRQAELEQQRAAAASRRVRAAGVLAGVVLVVATAAGIGIQAARASGPAAPAPQAFSARDGVQFGRSGARTTIEIYEDPACATCAAFERQAASQLQTWIRSSTARVKYYEVSYLDNQSSTKYSTRAAAALYCAADAGRFQEYHDLLYAAPPAAGTPGPTDDQLTLLGPQAGITGDAQTAFTQCIATKKHVAFVGEISDDASRGGILSPPTVLVGGHPVQNPTLASVSTAVDAAV